MIDIDVAIRYIEEIASTFKEQRADIAEEQERISEVKKKLVLDTESLASQKSSFLEQTGVMTAAVERAEKLHSLAVKMKAQVEGDLDEVRVEQKKLSSREKNIINLEKKQKELQEREALCASREEDVENREILVAKDKLAAREKQSDLDMREKTIAQTQERLNKMIAAQSM